MGFSDFLKKERRGPDSGLLKREADLYKIEGIGTDLRGGREIEDIRN